MFKSYLKIAFRNLRRQKGYAFINIAGLSVGLACSFFIVLWVVDEVSYDRFHEHRDDLYLAMRHMTLSGQTYTFYDMPRPVADALEEEYPEVEHATLLTYRNESLLTHEDRAYREEGHYAGPAFFQDFSFPLLQGEGAGHGAAAEGTGRVPIRPLDPAHRRHGGRLSSDPVYHE